MIGLESLFATGRTESRHKISRRVAVFLKTKRDDRIEICREMKNAYDLRSDIVHGEEVDFEEIKKCWYKVRSNLRDCLKKIVEEGYYKRDSLIKTLDFG